MEKSILILTLSVLFFACSPIEDGISTIIGNYSFQRGDYQAAALNYLAVLEKGEFEIWSRYNLGIVYQALGEAQSAQEQWNQVRGQEMPEDLSFRLHFNLGVLEYQQGNYEQSFLDFKQALGFRPESLETKKNLELALLKIQSGEGDGNQRGNASPSETEPSGETQALLDYIRRLEGNQWNEPVDSPQVDTQDW